VKWTFLVAGFIGAAGTPAAEYVCDSVPQGVFRFEGAVGERIEANTRNWLCRAPEANPALLDMFALRDRKPAPDLVDWAGEFVGKYLISGVQALRMSGDPCLRKTLDGVVGRLLELQAEDGYLGPWPKHERLLGHWDLWGHYHVMLGLMMWHEYTKEERALAAARRIADLACAIYLDGPRKVKDARSHEMNMSILHGLALLHQRTGEVRYLRLCEQIVEQLAETGDYLRTGLKGVEFFKTPRPRWESLHALQGLAEMWRITGDERYRRAFLHHWASIRRFDVHNNGAFSSGEQATGNPFSEGAIETCCTIAWTAVMIDALRLTGDAGIADDLELTFYNGICGAQHSSGSWWTYDTPMNGRRAASQHSIVFQARPGSPELNCCSVNGPRGLGMLSEWAVMRGTNGWMINYLAPFEARLDATLTLRVVGNYPIGTNVSIEVDAKEPRTFTLALRMPRTGKYREFTRTWRKSERIDFAVDLPAWYEVGDREQAGKVSLYRGPILLAWDQRFNASDEIAVIDVRKLQLNVASHPGAWLLAEAGGLKLCDYASAGTTGARYRSWLPATNLPPPRPAQLKPRDGERVPMGPMEFAWRLMQDRRSEVIVSVRERNREVLRWTNVGAAKMLVSESETKKLKAGVAYEWKLVARNEYGESESLGPTRRFEIDESLPKPAEARGDGVLVIAPLRDGIVPEYGQAGPSRGWKNTEDGIETDGNWDSSITYELEEFPESDYTVSVFVKPKRLPEKGLGQVFSAWAKGSDDPLRLVIEKGKLYARIEAGQGTTTEGVQIEAGRWWHVAATKEGQRLTLFVNGNAAGHANAPWEISSESARVALGGNPLYRGASEFLAATFAHFRMYARALTPEEIATLAKTR
jgi:uncharacterized protein